MSVGNKLYHLDGLRFILAGMVFYFHAEMSKAFFPELDIIGPRKPIMLGAETAVTGFFALSGFLITFLLLKEQARRAISGIERPAISLKNFYIRRLLRIWPVYYISILLYIVILPNTDLVTLLDYDLGNKVESFALNTNFPVWAKYLLLLLFLPHLLFAIGVFFPGAHIWSIGVEEQFYLGWPLLFRNRKINLKKAILAVIVIYCVLFYGLIIASLLLKIDLREAQVMGVTIKFLYLQRISCMAIGGLIAIIFFDKPEKHWVRSKVTFYISAFILAFFILRGIRVPILHAEIYSLLFAIVFLHLSDWPHGKIRLLDNKVMNYLGSISYGIYMYNPLAIVLVVYLALQPYTPTPSGFTDSAIYTGICLGLTLLISTLSYELMEKRLLRWKDKFN